MNRGLVFAALMACVLAVPDVASTVAVADTSAVASSEHWRTVRRVQPRRAADEQRIAAIVARMTLREKIGQMTQAEIRSVTPEDVQRYSLGSVLNGGGAWPKMNRQASVGDWLALAQRFHTASLASSAGIPVVWGTDAVHGHNNVFGATLFPHNIGLGAAQDPALVEQVGRAVGAAVRATGIRWVFAPTLAVAGNARWGRTYESFSADPLLVEAYAKA